MAVIQPMRAYKGGVFTPSEYACKNEVYYFFFVFFLIRILYNFSFYRIY